MHIRTGKLIKDCCCLEFAVAVNLAIILRIQSDSTAILSLTFGMMSISKLNASLVSGQNENTLALANINFDFALLKVEAPPEYHSVGQALSPTRRKIAEDGDLHRIYLSTPSDFVYANDITSQRQLEDSPHCYVPFYQKLPTF
jgi:hypothetical protein